ncbi:hypothetical protein GIB67_002710 [Kingdonia uniflora]|uniref:RING-type domain-containing protein n=1 Tax=Kingdonia uniflora TaxID=39325 RepID=A0A7J7LJK9_9MAGN|nr:hypothetical protein GIB67_002710 [Kingdonia uniflora]
MGNKLGRRRQVVDEKYTRPQGLYQIEGVDTKRLRKLILDSKLAPCYPGEEDCSCDLEECPICFLYYPSLNRSRCCTKGICTECFLQMKPPHSTRPTQCPFCKTSNYAVEYRGMRSKEEKGIEQVEEQRVIEAKIRMQQQELHDEEGRMHRKQEISSSSGVMTPGQVGYMDLVSSSSGSVPFPSLSFPIEGDEIISSQDPYAGSITTQPSHFRRNRNDQFDVDLEDLMMMEAIWLSIQGFPPLVYFDLKSLGVDSLMDPVRFYLLLKFDHCIVQIDSFWKGGYGVDLVVPLSTAGTSEVHIYHGTSRITVAYEQDNDAQRNIGDPGHSPFDPIVAEHRYVSTAVAPVFDTSSSPSGGLACAVAALAERQHIDKDYTNDASTSGEERMIEGYTTENWNVVSQDSDRNVFREEREEWVANHGSEMAEAGTSYAGSDARMDISIGDQFQHNVSGSILPESYEDQMMLAMAVSLADARGRKNTRGVSWF